MGGGMGVGVGGGMGGGMGVGVGMGGEGVRDGGWGWGTLSSLSYWDMGSGGIPSTVQAVPWIGEPCIPQASALW